MATWMEMRCDVNADPKSYDNKCWSSVNAGPMQMAGDTHTAVLGALKDLQNEAFTQGWQRIPGGWACPHCKKP